MLNKYAAATAAVNGAPLSAISTARVHGVYYLYGTSYTYVHVVRMARLGGARLEGVAGFAPIT